MASIDEIGGRAVPRKVHVVTTSGFPYEAPIEDNRARALSYVEAAGRRGADLVCLPETFLGRHNIPVPEALEGPTFGPISELARRYGIWVVAGTLVREQDDAPKRNCAVVFDRSGSIAASYAKVHPTINECEGSGVTPGDGAVVIDTDFGRLGLAICYDIGWPAHWAALAERRAEIVVWPSAYDGGFPLQSYAWTHRFHLVSAVLSNRAKVLDITGRVLAVTSDWHPVVDATVDVEKELFHADSHEATILRIESELGSRVSVVAYDEERYFTLESNDAEWPVSRLKDHYGLESFADYHARAGEVQDRHRLEMAVGV
jgi:predicted amidohydrolase